MTQAGLDSSTRKKQVVGQNEFLTQLNKGKLNKDEMKFELLEFVKPA